MSEMNILIGHVEKLCNKIDKIDEKVDQIQITQAVQAKDIEANKMSLDAHMENNRILKGLYDKVSDRVDILEEPGIVRKHLWKIILGFIAISGCVLGYLKFFN